jgi:hypothetical protein
MRTDFHLRVGKPFHLDTRGEKVTRQVRGHMLEQMMFQLANVLPEQYRGIYSEQPADKPRYIQFIE